MHLSDFTFNVVDIETTGFDAKKEKVVSIASVICSIPKGIIHTDYAVVDPGIVIPPEAMAVHHITDNDVAGKPALDSVIHRFVGPSVKADMYVAHNAIFDFSFVPNHGVPVLCTMRLARKLFPDLASAKNQVLRYFFNLNVDTSKYGPAHHALSDAVVTSNLLLFLLGILESRAKDTRSFEAGRLVEWVNDPMLLTTCRFGNKHYGQKWSEVPKSYLKWMTEKVSDMDSDTRFTVEYWLAH